MRQACSLTERFGDFNSTPCSTRGLLRDTNDVSLCDLDFFLSQKLLHVFRYISLIFVGWQLISSYVTLLWNGSENRVAFGRSEGLPVGHLGCWRLYDPQCVQYGRWKETYTERKGEGVLRPFKLAWPS
jgi:hypothetical protein